MADIKPAELEHVLRMKALQVHREQERKQMQEKIARLQEEAQKGLQPIDAKFAMKDPSLEDQLKAETVGLVTLDEFRKKKMVLESDELKKDDDKRQTKKAKTDKVAKHKLSFAFEEGEEESENNNNTNDEPVKKKVLKNPDVETSFLPDKERDELEMKQREELAKQWKEEQQRIKNEDIDIVYSYWDGSTGHRRVLRVKKGSSIMAFLERVKYEFRELRSVPLENLMFVKQNFIISQLHTFYDLLLTEARGQTGPLFQFEFAEETKLGSELAKDKDEVHLAKVVEKKWYEKNKLNYPASKWEVFDPFASTSKYTIQTKQF